MGWAAGLAALVGMRAAAGVSAPPLTPDAGNTWDLYAGAEEQYDSNLFRVPSSQGSVATLVSPGASRSDDISTISAGYDGQWILGRQVVNLDLHADQNWFAHNSFLNNTSYDGKVLWNWQVGPHFSGTLGATDSHELVSFGETLYLGRDFVDAADYFGTGRFQLGPHWAVYGGLNDSTINHSAFLAQTDDFKTQAGKAGVEYEVDALDTFSLEYRYDDGRFRSGQVDVLDGIDFSPNFHDDTVLFLLTRAISDKTQVVADAGYLKRFYPNTQVGSFSGDVWRITVNWQATDKTQVIAAAWHELHAYLVSQSNYFVSEGGSVKPVWSPTDKITLGLLVSYENQNYIPQGNAIIAAGPINAKVAQEQFDANYSPRDNWIFTLSYVHQQRHSNTPLFVYGDDRAMLSVLYKTR